MKQIYYVIQTLLRGRGSNIIKIISLGLSLTMSILLFSRVAYEQSFDTCYKDYDNPAARAELRPCGGRHTGELSRTGGSCYQHLPLDECPVIQ